MSKTRAELFRKTDDHSDLLAISPDRKGVNVDYLGEREAGNRKTRLKTFARNFQSRYQKKNAATNLFAAAAVVIFS